MKIRAVHEREGQALIQVALALVALLAFLALAIDVGHFYGERRHMQNAADAGALAGARELCLGHSADAAIAAAQEYAQTRNGAQAAAVSVNGSTVNVVASETTNTFFAGLIGIPSADIGAEAAAACGKARSACSLWPVAFRLDRWNQLREACGTEFLVWDDTKEIDCTVYDCDLNDDGRDDIVTGGYRAWMDFSSAQAPYSDSCDQPGCGASELACRIANDYDGQLTLPTCVAGDEGVKAGVQNAVDSRIGDSVKIPVYDGYCGGGPGGGCGSGIYHVVEFGCIRVLGWATVKFEPLPGYTEPVVNAKVIRAAVDCNGCETNCGGTSGGSAGTGGVSAVSLIK